MKCEAVRCFVAGQEKWRGPSWCYVLSVAGVLVMVSVRKDSRRHRSLKWFEYGGHSESTSGESCFRMAAILKQLRGEVVSEWPPF